MKLPNKIYIIGIMGSGKTTLSRKLSHITKIKHYSLDDIYHVVKFTKKRSSEAREKKLNELLKKKKWIVEGVHNKWTENIFKTADLVIWLDLHPRFLVFHLLKRSFKREDDKAKYEHIRDSIKYAINYRKGSKKYVWHKTMIDKHKPNLVHIQTKKQLRKFLRELK
jgi:adenylate kinase family enzyme